MAATCVLSFLIWWHEPAVGLLPFSFHDVRSRQKQHTRVKTQKLLLFFWHAYWDKSTRWTLPNWTREPPVGRRRNCGERWCLTNVFWGSRNFQTSVHCSIGTNRSKERLSNRLHVTGGSSTLHRQTTDTQNREQRRWPSKSNRQNKYNKGNFNMCPT